MASQSDGKSRWVAVSCEIVATYLRHNALPVAQVPDLIVSVHAALEDLRTGEVAKSNLVKDGHIPATPVQIRASITHEALISFEDGRPYKALKRHLNALGLTPNAYRAKWGLPADYPMVSTGYTKRRSDIAKAIGLGRAVSLAEAAE